MKRTLEQWKEAWKTEKKDFPESMQMLGNVLLGDWEADKKVEILYSIQGFPFAYGDVRMVTVSQYQGRINMSVYLNICEGFFSLMDGDAKKFLVWYSQSEVKNG